MVKPKPSRQCEINAGAELRSKNPLISLFGRWGLSGKVGIGNAIPDGDNQWGMFGGGARSIMFQRDESLMEFLETDQLIVLNACSRNRLRQVWISLRSKQSRMHSKGDEVG